MLVTNAALSIIDVIGDFLNVSSSESAEFLDGIFSVSGLYFKTNN